MRKHASAIGAAVLVAGLGAGCTGRTDKVDNPRVAQSGGNRGTHERVTLQGCVQAATPAGDYVLRKVSVPPPAAQPQGQETMEHRFHVEPGSWVRLTGASDELKSNLGKRVSLTGEVVDSGANTLGTSGRTTPAKEAQSTREKFEQSSKDANSNPERATPPTTAAPMGAEANGTAPQIAVEKVQTIGDSCDAK